jgi:small subunit ribosomal protein S5
MRQQKRRFGGKKSREADEFEQRVVDIRRVTKVNSGSKRLRMSVLVVVGDKKGRVGVAIGRGLDVRDATAKAVKKAKKNIVFVNLKNQTIPHEIVHKYGAAKIFLKPAAPGTGVIAGSAVRSVVELAGIKDILSKSIGTNNKILSVYCTVEALQRLKSVKL